MHVYITSSSISVTSMFINERVSETWLFCNALLFQSMDNVQLEWHSITVQYCSVYSRNAIGMPIILMSITWKLLFV